jgi:hypothetical protein
VAISLEILTSPSNLVPIAQAARSIGAGRSWAFAVHRRGLLKTAQGSRPVLVSVEELRTLDAQERRRPRRAPTREDSQRTGASEPARRALLKGR